MTETKQPWYKKTATQYGTMVLLALAVMGKDYVLNIFETGVDTQFRLDVEEVVINSDAIAEATLEMAISPEVIERFLKAELVQEFTDLKANEMISRDTNRAGMRGIISIEADVSKPRVPYHLGAMVKNWVKEDFVLKKDLDAYIKNKVCEYAKAYRNNPRGTTCN